jgi:ammonium transporter, Amt family
VNATDTAWMLVSTALVLLMTPALAFFYAGLVRSKNALNTLMMSFVSLGVVGLAWVFLGYSLAFGGTGPLLGNLDHALLRGVDLDVKGTIPHLLFMAYQGTFAIITAALISGAVVERMRFATYVAFVVVWSLVVYAPVAHWVWGGGWLARMGALDFAGGTVVHITAGTAAVVAPASSDPGRTTPDRPSSRIQCRSLRSAPVCFGSGGSGSTAAARSAPTTRRCSPSSTRCSPPWRQLPPGR